MTILLVVLAVLAYVSVVHLKFEEGRFGAINVTTRSYKQWQAERARHAKWETYYVEFLGYGFPEGTAKMRADAKMDADAKAADEVLNAKGAK